MILFQLFSNDKDLNLQMESFTIINFRGVSTGLILCICNVIVQISAFQRKQQRGYYFVQLNTQYQIVEQRKLEVR